MSVRVVSSITADCIRLENNIADDRTSPRLANEKLNVLDRRQAQLSCIGTMIRLSCSASSSSIQARSCKRATRTACTSRPTNPTRKRPRNARSRVTRVPTNKRKCLGPTSRKILKLRRRRWLNQRRHHRRNTCSSILTRSSIESLRAKTFFTFSANRTGNSARSTRTS